jgi:DNA-binding NarL/FixJ family response regulator
VEFAEAPVRIVIADDSEDLRRLLFFQLAEDPRFEVVGWAGSGDHVAPVVDAHRPDVVLTDLNMGTYDGVALIRDLLSHYPDTRVVANTATAPPSVVDEIRALGVPVVYKGQPEELAAALVGQSRRRLGRTDPGAMPDRA